MKLLTYVVPIYTTTKEINKKRKEIIIKAILIINIVLL